MHTNLFALIAGIALVNIASAQENGRAPETILGVGVGVTTLNTTTPVVIYEAAHRTGHFLMKAQVRRISDDAVPGEANIGALNLTSGRLLVGVTTKPLGTMTAAISAGAGYRWGMQRGRLLRDSTWYTTRIEDIDWSLWTGFRTRTVSVPHIYKIYESREVSEIEIPFEATLTVGLSRHIAVTLTSFGTLSAGELVDCGLGAGIGFGW